MRKIRVAVNGYGVIGKRIADAVALQDDMELVGIADVVTDWRIKAGDIVIMTGAYLLNSEYIFKKGANPMEGMKM